MIMPIRIENGCNAIAIIKGEERVVKVVDLKAGICTFNGIEYTGADIVPLKQINEDNIKSFWESHSNWLYESIISLNNKFKLLNEIKKESDHLYIDGLTITVGSKLVKCIGHYREATCWVITGYEELPSPSLLREPMYDPVELLKSVSSMEIIKKVFNIFLMNSIDNWSGN